MHNRKPELQGKHAIYQGFSFCLLRNWIYVPPLRWEALPLLSFKGWEVLDSSYVGRWSEHSIFNRRETRRGRPPLRSADLFQVTFMVSSKQSPLSEGPKAYSCGYKQCVTGHLREIKTQLTLVTSRNTSRAYPSKLQVGFTPGSD